MEDKEPVACTIEQIEMENDHGREVAGTRATCGKCSHETESFGTSDKSALRCLALLREECPLGESNFYVDEDD